MKSFPAPTALTLNGVQLYFGFDKERLNPNSVCKYPIKDSNRWECKRASINVKFL